jgi:hypothetical protein
MPAFSLFSRTGLTPHKHIVIIYLFLIKVNAKIAAKFATFELSKMPIKKDEMSF